MAAPPCTSSSDSGHSRPARWSGVSQLIELPESLDALVGAMLGCATVTAFGAAKQQARIGEGDSVLVTGVGGVGLNSIIAARHYGARHITAYDVHESKRELAFRCGADEFHTPTTAGAIASIAPAEGFDVVLECTGGGTGAAGGLPLTRLGAADASSWACPLTAPMWVSRSATFSTTSRSTDAGWARCRRSTSSPPSWPPRSSGGENSTCHLSSPLSFPPTKCERPDHGTRQGRACPRVSRLPWPLTKHRPRRRMS